MALACRYLSSVFKRVVQDICRRPIGLEPDYLLAYSFTKGFN